MHNYGDCLRLYIDPPQFDVSLRLNRICHGEKKGSLR